MAVNRTVTSRLLRGLQPWLAARGQLSLLADVGLDPAAALDVDGVVSFDALLELLERIAALEGRDSLGLRLGAEHDASTGLFHYIVVSAPNLSEALRRSTIFFGLVTNSYTVSFEQDEMGGDLTWHFTDPPERRVQFTQLAIGVVVSRIRLQIGGNWNPVYVDFDFARPSHIGDFECILRCDVRFSQPKSGIRIDHAALVSKMANADPQLSETLENVARRKLGLPKETSPLVEKLADVVRRALPEGNLTDEMAAERLGMSKRSLDRQLDQAGTSYRSVLDEVRAGMTKHLLEETEIPLTEVAFLLGYSELSAFSRAAKNWLDESPSSYRKRMRASA